MRVVVHTEDGGDGGAVVFREADGGENNDISGGATGAAHGRRRGKFGAGIGRRNSEDGSKRQGAAVLISTWRSGRKRLDMVVLGCGAR
jgi:hypothetical protein